MLPKITRLSYCDSGADLLQPGEAFSEFCCGWIAHFDDGSTVSTWRTPEPWGRESWHVARTRLVADPTMAKLGYEPKRVRTVIARGLSRDLAASLAAAECQLPAARRAA